MDWVDSVPAHWLELDPRIEPWLSLTGPVMWCAEHVLVREHELVRRLDLAVQVPDPLVEIERIGRAIVWSGLPLVIVGQGIRVIAEGLRVYLRGEHHVTVQIELTSPHATGDLRHELVRHPALASWIAMARAARRITRVESGWQAQGEPWATMTMGLDDATRARVVGRLIDLGFTRDETAWRRTTACDEQVVAFERSPELGIDEASLFVRARAEPYAMIELVTAGSPVASTKIRRPES